MSATPPTRRGVTHTLGSYQVNVDNTAPTGYFIRANASDPRKVTLYATDNNGSGIGKVLIELVDATARSPNLALTSNTTGDGDYTAELPPDNQMAKGSYTLQAVVTDNAGNVTNPPLDEWQGATAGGTAVIKYPLPGSAGMIDALGAGTAAPLLPGDKGTTSTRKLKTKKVRVKVQRQVGDQDRPGLQGHPRQEATASGSRSRLRCYVTVKADRQGAAGQRQDAVKLAYRGAVDRRWHRDHRRGRPDRRRQGADHPDRQRRRDGARDRDDQRQRPLGLSRARRPVAAAWTLSTWAPP